MSILRYLGFVLVERDEAALCDSDEKRVGGWREVKYNSQIDKAKVGGLPTWPQPMYDVCFLIGAFTS